MKCIRITLVLMISLCLLGYSQEGFAQNYPTKPIRVIIPFTAGSTNTLIVRALQKRLSKELNGATFVVENIPAGTTKMATLEVMKAEPDGYTLYCVSPEALMGYFYSGSYNFRAWEEMTYIAQIGYMPYALLEVRADSPFKTWGDLVNFAKKNPGKLTCGGPAAGGVVNMVAIDTAKNAGIEIKYVPFAGAAPSNIALMGGHVNYRVCVSSDAAPNIRAGLTRGLAISNDKRLAEMPDVPTFKEVGFTGLMSELPPFSYVLYGPPKLPETLRNQISKAVEKSITDPEYVEYCRSVIIQPVFKDAQTAKQDMKFFAEKVGGRLEVLFPKK